jgi:prophage regulatory protein
MGERFLRTKEVLELVGYKSVVSLYEAERAGRFPKRRQLGPNRVGWLASEIDAWLKSRPVAACVAEAEE